MSTRAGQFKEFTPALVEPLGAGLELLVERAGLDREGEAVIFALITRAGLPRHEDAVLHKDRVLLATDQERRRFLKAAVALAPGLEPSRLAAVLLKLSLTLPALVGGAGGVVVQQDTAALWDQAHSLAEAPDLLEQIAQMIRAQGIVGEERKGLLLYLSATARLCKRPVSVLVKGASGSGKDELMFAVLALLPDDAYLSYSAITTRYLIHSSADLSHRVLILAEASGIARGDGAYIVRTLLSEGRLRYGTAAGGGQEITKEGPTTLWTSTILTHLDPELETRALSLTMRDDEAQNRAVMERMALTYGDTGSVSSDRTASQALQDWLALAGERRVHIPYARGLARQMRHATEVRVRRDFRKVLDLIAACAILHQAQRERAEDGAIIASLGDYATVRDLVHEAFTSAQQDAITPQQREAAAAVADLSMQLPTEPLPDAVPGVPLIAIAERLGISKSSASRRLEPLVKAGYVRNLEMRRGRQGAFVPDLPLPEDQEALPTIEEVGASMATQGHDP